jgi:hypothetical protein
VDEEKQGDTVRKNQQQRGIGDANSDGDFENGTLCEKPSFIRDVFTKCLNLVGCSSHASIWTLCAKSDGSCAS